MKRTIFVLLCALALAACGQAVSAGTPSATQSKSATSVAVGSNAAVGSFLTTSAGRTLYYFTPEHDSHIICTGQCTKTWQPLLAPSGLLTTKTRLPGTLTTIPRGGTRQVTYSDWPLYTFSGDKAQGDTNGQGILGQWFVASTSLMEDLPTPTPAPTASPVVAPAPAATHAPVPAPTMRPTA
ncbi:MAG: hypothetical protein E6I88_11095, partial [Chloroflexi bacterium]